MRRCVDYDVIECKILTAGLSVLTILFYIYVKRVFVCHSFLRVTAVSPSECTIKPNLSVKQFRGLILIYLQDKHKSIIEVICALLGQVNLRVYNIGLYAFA